MLSQPASSIPAFLSWEFSPFSSSSRELKFLVMRSNEKFLTLQMLSHLSRSDRPDNRGSQMWQWTRRIHRGELRAPMCLRLGSLSIGFCIRSVMDKNFRKLIRTWVFSPFRHRRIACWRLLRHRRHLSSFALALLPRIFKIFRFRLLQFHKGRRCVCRRQWNSMFFEKFYELL